MTELSKYKVDINPMACLDFDNVVGAVFSKRQQDVIKISSDISNYITSYNRLVALREEVATIPNEYMSIKLPDVDSKELRKLLIGGIEAELKWIHARLMGLKEDYIRQFPK